MISVRPLKREDLTRQYFSLLDQLSPRTAKFTSDFYFNNEVLYNFQRYSRNPDHTILVAIQDDVVIGTAAILIEYKIRGDACAHIEDVVVAAQRRTYGTGRLLIEKLIEIAKDHQCYKAILDCSENNVSFYEKCGFRKYENCMRMDLNESSVD